MSGSEEFPLLMEWLDSWPESDVCSSGHHIKSVWIWMSLNEITMCESDVLQTVTSVPSVTAVQFELWQEFLHYCFSVSAKVFLILHSRMAACKWKVKSVKWALQMNIFSIVIYQFLLNCLVCRWSSLTKGADHCQLIPAVTVLSYVECSYCSQKTCCSSVYWTTHQRLFTE